MNPELKSKIPMIVGAVIVVTAVLAIVYSLMARPPRPAGTVVAPATEAQPPAGASIAKPDLGSTLYENAKNPISKKLPESAAPVPNPIQGIYKNPFE